MRGARKSRHLFERLEAAEFLYGMLKSAWSSNLVHDDVGGEAHNNPLLEIAA